MLPRVFYIPAFTHTAFGQSARKLSFSDILAVLWCLPVHLLLFVMDTLQIVETEKVISNALHNGHQWRRKKQSTDGKQGDMCVNDKKEKCMGKLSTDKATHRPQKLN